MSEFVEVENFGKDHWSMLAYVETCCVDGTAGVGRLDRSRVRCNESKHPLLSVNTSFSWKDANSTRLSGFFDFENRSDAKAASEAGLMVLGHDDWDCLDDLENAGYVEVLSLSNPAVKMTGAGLVVAAQLRAHKAAGGNFAGFTLPSLAEAEVQPRAARVAP